MEGGREGGKKEKEKIMSNSTAMREQETSAGVLLYYAYREIGHERREELAKWYEKIASPEGLVGRVRVALDGVNCTLGGRMQALDRHIQHVETHPLLGGSPTEEKIDWKLAPSNGPKNELCRIETGFDRLRISICKEVVALGVSLDPDAPKAPHVSPEEFHCLLQETGQAKRKEEGGRTLPSSSSSSLKQKEGEEVFLLDARNIYETRIGHFQAPGTSLLEPKTRQFSDLPPWLDAKAEELRGKKIMMYCTGGVRCERLSAYIRAKGEGFENIVQLKGGIQRYLEAFPDGGFFQGKNFVFDERIAVGPSFSSSGQFTEEGGEEGKDETIGPCSYPSSSMGVTTGQSNGRRKKEEEGEGGSQSNGGQKKEEERGGQSQGKGRGEGVIIPPSSSSSSSSSSFSVGTVVGHCLVCQRAWDDYSARVRCRRCRMLLLVCDSCCYIGENGESKLSLQKGGRSESKQGGREEEGGDSGSEEGRGGAGGLLCEHCIVEEGEEEGKEKKVGRRRRKKDKKWKEGGRGRVSKEAREMKKKGDMEEEELQGADRLFEEGGGEIDRM